MVSFSSRTHVTSNKSKFCHCLPYQSQVYSVAGYHITSQVSTMPGVKYIMYSFLVCEDNEHLSMV